MRIRVHCEPPNADALRAQLEESLGEHVRVVKATQVKAIDLYVKTEEWEQLKSSFSKAIQTFALKVGEDSVVINRAGVMKTIRVPATAAHSSDSRDRSNSDPNVGVNDWRKRAGSVSSTGSARSTKSAPSGRSKKKKRKFRTRKRTKSYGIPPAILKKAKYHEVLIERMLWGFSFIVMSLLLYIWMKAGHVWVIVPFVVLSYFALDSLKGKSVANRPEPVTESKSRHRQEGRRRGSRGS